MALNDVINEYEKTILELDARMKIINHDLNSCSDDQLEKYVVESRELLKRKLAYFDSYKGIMGAQIKQYDDDVSTKKQELSKIDFNKDILKGIGAAILGAALYFGVTDSTVIKGVGAITSIAGIGYTLSNAYRKNRSYKLLNIMEEELQWIHVHMNIAERGARKTRDYLAYSEHEFSEFADNKETYIQPEKETYTQPEISKQNLDRGELVHGELNRAELILSGLDRTEIAPGDLDNQYKK